MGILEKFYSILEVGADPEIVDEIVDEIERLHGELDSLKIERLRKELEYAQLDRCKKEMLEIADRHEWKSITEEWSFDVLDLLCADGSILREAMPQSDGDFYWNGAGPEIFIDPKYSSDITHWRVAAPKPGEKE